MESMKQENIKNNFDSIHNHLNSFYSWPIKFTQFVGLCIFSIDSTTSKVHFRSWSFANALGVLHFLISMLWWVWFLSHKSDFARIPSGFNSVDQVSYMVVSSVSYFGLILLRIYEWRHTDKYLITWNEIHQTLIQIYETSGPLTRAYIQHALKIKKNRFRYVTTMISVSIIGLIFRTIDGFTLKLVEYFPLYRAIINLLGMILWNANLIIHIARVFCLCQVMTLISIQFGSLSKMTLVRSGESCLNHYSALEKLVYKFNKTVSNQLILSVGIMITNLVNSLYSISVHIEDVGFFGIKFQSLLVLICNGLGIFILFSCGSSITRKSQSAISNIQECIKLQTYLDFKRIDSYQNFDFTKALLRPPIISPGNFFILSRKTLTSILGSILTYMVVLLQFRSTNC